MKMDVSKNGQLWGIATLVIYAGAVGFMLYMWRRDSKNSDASWDALRTKISDTFGMNDATRFGYAQNGKVDERTASTVVEDHRDDNAESDTAGL